MQPLQTVEDAGFRNLLHTIEPRYIPPSRKTLRMNYLPSLYEQERKKISEKVSAIDYIALTTFSYYVHNFVGCLSFIYCCRLFYHLFTVVDYL